MKLRKIMFVFAIISISYLEALILNDSYNLNLPVSDYLKMQSVFDSVSAKTESKKFAEAEKISQKYEQQFPEMAFGYFLDFYIGSHHWPAFNVADSAISVGVGIFLITQFLEDRREKRDRVPLEE